MSEREKFNPEKEGLKWLKVSEKGSVDGFVDVYDPHNEDFQSKVKDGYILVKTNQGREGHLENIDFQNGEKVEEIAYTKKWQEYKEGVRKRVLERTSIYTEKLIKEINNQEKTKEPTLKQVLEKLVKEKTGQKVSVNLKTGKIKGEYLCEISELWFKSKGAPEKIIMDLEVLLLNVDKTNKENVVDLKEPAQS